MSDISEDSLCDFCRLPCPEMPVTLVYGDTTYELCSETCRDEMAENDRVFTTYHGFRQTSTGVSALDDFLPQGLPRNSFVLLSGEGGTRDNAIETELVWRALRRGEPAIIISLTEPPISVIEQFLSLEWNVLPYLESGLLHVLDCFTYRVGDRDRMFSRMDEWNQFLHRVTTSVTTTVRDPGDTSELQNKLDNCLESLSMGDSGIVVIDSLTELGTLVQPVQAYDFVKDIRADVCKGRFVTVFAGATFAGEDDVFPHDMGYVIDGLIDLQLNGSLVDDVLIKRIRIRKMNGVLTIPEWVAYEYTGGDGLVTFDPVEEIEAAKEPEDTDDPNGSDDPEDAHHPARNARTDPDPSE